MNRHVADILSFLFIAVAVVLALILYPDLPEHVPIHWNAAGEIDGYMRKPWGVITMPLAAVFTFVLMKIIPAISPKVNHVDKFRGALSLLQVVMVGFMSGIAVLVLLAANGVEVAMNRAIFAGLGILFLVIGIILPRVGQNYFMGVRTPWTLASEEVWERTHRHAGRLFIISSVILFINVFVVIRIGWTIGLIILLVLWLALYSYLVHRRIERD